MPYEGGIHTIGDKNATGTVGTTSPGRSCLSWIFSNEAWRFY